MTPVGFEPTISVGERPQTHALDRADTGTGMIPYKIENFLRNHILNDENISFIFYFFNTQPAISSLHE